MRTLVRWIVITFGIAALVRWFRRRSASPGELEAPESPALEDPAEELRRRLAESRAMETEAESAPASDPSVEERRADVHSQGRAALAEMTSSEEN